jgi:hypothetical protein
MRIVDILPNWLGRITKNRHVWKHIKERNSEKIKSPCNSRIEQKKLSQTIETINITLYIYRARERNYCFIDVQFDWLLVGDS